ncbi:M24 family metallopeptidase [Sphingobium rhizovicinum]|uniref:M24 family metallopeptidase n=1 Tax=Sphingobium rhizovicinum TaxID=432308 RepID=A0ABV7NLV6_9SPHN
MSLPTPLMNRDRAETVMAAAGVSAFVLTDPINIYHATGFWPQTVAMGQLGTALAVVPVDRNSPAILITSQFIHYFFDMDAVDADGPLRIFLYTAPGSEPEGAAAPPSFFRSAPGGAPDPFERATRASTLDLLERAPAYSGQRSALGDALAAIAPGSLIAADGPLPQSLLGDNFVWRAAEPLLRRVRMIKSAHEIALMRHAARNNAEAARASVLSMREGDSYEELRLAFHAETGRRGGVPLFLSVDNIAYRQRDGLIREGRAFQVDAVSHYGFYHGDYGRTVCVGEPGQALKDAMEAAQIANDAVARTLRPGIRYSDVMAAGRGAIAAAGFDMATPSSPHSVGLFHTDEAYADDALHFVKADHLIEQDMILSVDCPIMQTDMGGTVHLEDLWLITQDGCEPLNDTAHPFIRI